jgi:hypothetical protein
VIEKKVIPISRANKSQLIERLNVIWIRIVDFEFRNKLIMNHLWNSKSVMWFFY